MSDDELKKNEDNIPSNPKGGEVSSKSIAGNKLDIKVEKKPVNDSVESKEKENEIISGDSVKKTDDNKNIEKKPNQNEKNSKSNKVNNNNKQSKNNPSNKNYSEESEFIEKLVSINRVAKVVKGGRRFSFAALVVVGDGNGMVGHGKGKSKEVPEAIKKATDEAKAKMIRVPLRQARTLHHDITGRYDAGKVKLRSAPSGTGVIAGGPMRSVFEALGIKDIVAKSIGSSNPHNMIRATFDALSSASSPKLISTRRGLKVNEITKRRKGATVNQENTDV
jgi:small subunit ribosomal protein S5